MLTQVIIALVACIISFIITTIALAWKEGIHINSIGLGPWYVCFFSTPDDGTGGLHFMSTEFVSFWPALMNAFNTAKQPTVASFGNDGWFVSLRRDINHPKLMKLAKEELFKADNGGSIVNTMLKYLAKYNTGHICPNCIGVHRGVNMTAFADEVKALRSIGLSGAALMSCIEDAYKEELAVDVEEP